MIPLSDSLQGSIPAFQESRVQLQRTLTFALLKPSLLHEEKFPAPSTYHRGTENRDHDDAALKPRRRNTGAWCKLRGKVVGNVDRYC